jgi:hypothetical protein
MANEIKLTVSFVKLESYTFADIFAAFQVVKWLAV